MRPLLVASFIILSLTLFHLLRGVTHDPLIAAVFGLVLLSLVASWFGGRPAAHGGAKKW